LTLQEQILETTSNFYPAANTCSWKNTQPHLQTADTSIKGP